MAPITTFYLDGESPTATRSQSLPPSPPTPPAPKAQSLARPHARSEEGYVADVEKQRHGLAAEEKKEEEEGQRSSRVCGRRFPTTPLY